MPCQLQPWEIEIENARIRQENADAAEEKAYINIADRLTKENDELREIVLAFVDNSETKLPTKTVTRIRKSQTEHRKEDLDRLAKTFMKAKDADRLRLVWKADPTKPLEPQLGFNPDEF